jgi:hypothetical protein
MVKGHTSVRISACAAAAVVVLSVTIPHARAHHCGNYGTHTKDGWCLKKKPPHWPKYQKAQPGGLKAKTPNRQGPK